MEFQFTHEQLIKDSEKDFLATKRYYIFAYSAIQDWFGNRGIPIEEGDLKEWCYDGTFLYFTLGDNAPEELEPEKPYDVVVCALLSDCYEPEDFLTYEDSPFNNKIKE